MKILYQDLINFLSDKPSKEDLSEKLFQLGHEHEIFDDIYDMDLTPNRGDCLSLNGLARDLEVFFGKSEAIDIFEDSIDTLEIDFENLSPSDCPKISFLEIEIEEPTGSISYMPYLENFFGTIGNKKTNLFTDISNFVSYELGQPTHCFDRETIKNKLIFENKNCNSIFKTLLGSEIALKDNNCVFSIDNKVISLAGIMGGASTACTIKTKKVLIECAYFNPESIIGKSIGYNLTSDAAHKFERGVDIASHDFVLRRFIKVVQDHVAIKSLKMKSFSYTKFQNSIIPFDINKINKVLGTMIGEQECLGYLENLGFDTSNQIKVPSYRHDIKTNNDLAEEIARVKGYNNIRSTPININEINDDKKETKTAKLESLLVENGFYEVINFPFTSFKEKKSIKIDNPLDSNRDNFRTSLRDSLVSNLLYNERRQKDCIKLFEFSDIYSKDIQIKQERKLGIIISGREGNNYKDFTKKLDKKYLDKLLDTDVYGDIFEIIEIPRDTLKTKKKEKIFYIELSLEDIPSSFFSNRTMIKKDINFIAYSPVSEYPSSTRDFSFLIDDLTQVNAVINILNKISDEIIKNSFMFDFYKNHANETVKLGYRFVFQSNHRTLSDLEINTKVKEILTPILKLDRVSIPGM